VKVWIGFMLPNPFFDGFHILPLIDSIEIDEPINGNNPIKI